MQTTYKEEIVRILKRIDFNHIPYDSKLTLKVILKDLFEIILFITISNTLLNYLLKLLVLFFTLSIRYSFSEREIQRIKILYASLFIFESNIYEPDSNRKFKIMIAADTISNVIS